MRITIFTMGIYNLDCDQIVRTHCMIYYNILRPNLNMTIKLESIKARKNHEVSMMIEMV